jgi:hypothetical protein
LSEYSERQNIRIVSIGAMASRALNRADKWHLISTYERSFYCSDQNGNLICIGRGIGRGPFNLLCSAGGLWPGDTLLSGKIFKAVENKFIHEGSRVSFDTLGASSWDKSLHDTGNTGEHLEEDLHWLACRAAQNAPKESFAWLIPPLVSGEPSPIAVQKDTIMGLLHKRVLEVTDNASQRPFSSVSTAVETGNTRGLEKLIGLGHGLTPSGDDFLAGVVMGLFKMQENREAELLACNLYRAAHGKTTAISLAFYRALAECWVAEPHSRFLRTLGRAEARERERSLNLVSSFGYTSGWDTLAGIVFGISLVLRPLIENRNHFMETVC